MFKNLDSSDVSIQAFKAHKNFTFTNNDSGSGVYLVKARSGSDVGNIFYNRGLIVLTDTGSYTNDLSEFTLKYKSTQTIYQREYVCSIDENEFQFTNNKTARVGQSGSVAIGPYENYNTERTKTTEDTFPYNVVGYATSSYPTDGFNIGTEFIGETTHSEFAPYITNVGLYNDRDELVAIGKPAAPIKNEKDLAITFVVRFDTN